MAPETATLSSTQAHALLDILVHHETYREIEGFKKPGTINAYGPPFQDDLKEKPQSPTLQTLLSRFVLKLPGLRDVSPDFWKVRVSALIDELSQAELSESYDKGLLGIRKTLATAISALIEYPARGVIAGVEKDDKADAKKEYDVNSPEDVLKAWHVALQAIVYGDLLDELVKKVGETDDLTKHDTLVQAMHEFILVK